MTEPGPIMRRLMLGKDLRKLRGKHTLKQVWEATGISESTVSRIERGKQVITPANVRLLCQHYGVGPPMLDMLVRQAVESNTISSLVLDSDSVPDWAEAAYRLQSESAETRTYQALLVPGAMQTPGYTYAIVAAGESSEVDSANEVKRREARKRRLLDGLWRYHAIVDEAALRRPVGGSETMAEQIDHLIELSNLPNVTLQVLPFTTGAHIAMTGSFMLDELIDDMTAVFVELDHTVWTGERPKDRERYGLMFDRLHRVALTPEASREWLVSLASYYRANGGRVG